MEIPKIFKKEQFSSEYDPQDAKDAIEYFRMIEEGELNTLNISREEATKYRIKIESGEASPNFVHTHATNLKDNLSDTEVK